MNQHARTMRDLLTRSRLSHRELVERSGVPTRSLSKYLAGDMSPTLPAVHKVLSVLGADLDVFQVRDVNRANKHHPRTVAPGDKTDEIIVTLLEVMKETGTTPSDLYRDTGICTDLLRRWVKGQTQPTLTSLDTAFNSLGYEMRIVE